MSDADNRFRQAIEENSDGDAHDHRAGGRLTGDAVGQRAMARPFGASDNGRGTGGDRGDDQVDEPEKVGNRSDGRRRGGTFIRDVVRYPGVGQADKDVEDVLPQDRQPEPDKPAQERPVGGLVARTIQSDRTGMRGVGHAFGNGRRLEAQVPTGSLPCCIKTRHSNHTALPSAISADLRNRIGPRGRPRSDSDRIILIGHKVTWSGFRSRRALGVARTADSTHRAPPRRQNALQASDRTGPPSPERQSELAPARS